MIEPGNEVPAGGMDKGGSDGKGGLIAIVIAALTVILVAIGTLHPIASAVFYAGGGGNSGVSQQSTSGPQSAVEALGTQIRLRAWDKAYSSLANKGEFTQPDFIRDLTGTALSLRTYATLDGFDLQPLHQSDTDAEFTMKLHWSSVVGTVDDTRDVHVVKSGGDWAVQWPLVQEQHAPPQVVPVNYLRWDVILRGSPDDWGAQDVEPPHVRIVDMHPMNRADGMVVMGELLNEDVMPAFVSVRATLIAKNGSIVDSEGTFDMILHTLLPKQVTPFIIQYPGVDLSQVSSIRMEPISVLVSASADPIIEVQNQKYDPEGGGVLTGQVANESGHTVNVAHVLSTFYDKNGQVIWVAGQYIDRALQPQTPTDFHIAVPEDLARKVSSQRTVVATYTSGGSL
ncbi:MAG TPA: hypothetical protein VGD64_01125 [Acidisarcina sp.]